MFMKTCLSRGVNRSRIDSIKIALRFESFEIMITFLSSNRQFTIVNMFLTDMSFRSCLKDIFGGQKADEL